jgi:hypothetical protein
MAKRIEPVEAVWPVDSIEPHEPVQSYGVRSEDLEGRRGQERETADLDEAGHDFADLVVEPETPMERAIHERYS